MLRRVCAAGQRRWAASAAADAGSKSRRRALHRDFVLLQHDREPANADVIVARLRESYSGLSAADRRSVVRHLATTFGRTSAGVGAAGTPDECVAARAALRCAYEDIWLRVAQQRGGVRLLIHFRKDLLADPSLRTDPHMRQMHSLLTDCIRLLFSAGLLEVRSLAWGSITPELLEFLDDNERVHRTRGDLRQWKQRLSTGRRVFAIFHPSMPEEPLIFIQVALTSGVPGCIRDVIGDATAEAVPEREASTAVFYSICTCNEGLSGIDLGNTLIKNVVARLRGDAGLPGLRTFVTLSPIPGYAAWLRRAQLPDNFAALRPLQQHLQGAPDAASVRAWMEDGSVAEAARTLCRQYLLHEKRRGTTAMDPVTNFHVGNGAAIAGLHLHGDPSENGLLTSLGFMVNYLYDLPELRSRSRAYRAKGTIVHTI